MLRAEDTVVNSHGTIFRANSLVVQMATWQTVAQRVSYNWPKCWKEEVQCALRIHSKETCTIPWLSVSEKALRFIKSNVVWFHGHLEDSLEAQNSSFICSFMLIYKYFTSHFYIFLCTLKFKNILKFKIVFVDSLSWPHLPPLVHLPYSEHHCYWCSWLFCH